MKKITFVLTFVLSFVWENKFCFADSYDYSPYVGGAYSYSHLTAQGISPKYNVAGIYIGSDYSKYFSTEVFYNQSVSRKNYPLNNKIKSSYRSYGLDLLTFLPVDCFNRFYLLATAGVGEYVFNIKNYPAKHNSESGWGYRFGGGLKVAMDNHWQARFITRYVKFDGAYGMNHDVEYSLGVEYHF